MIAFATCRTTGCYGLLVPTRRFVFNGSSRCAAGTSLNDALHTGPNLLPALADVVMRWQRHRYVFVADVEKMYRQIAVHSEDRSLQRILWREENQLAEYTLNTVTYGLACAPYFALRVLRQLATDEEERFSQGPETLRRVYMDDVLTGASTLESCRRLREQVSSLCMAGGFPLKKWATNDLLRDVPLECRLLPSADALLPAIDHAVLGLRWSPATDEFAPTVRRSPGVPSTKRTILSQTARLFDPLGWLAPIRAKLIIQAT